MFLKSPPGEGQVRASGRTVHGAMPVAALPYPAYPSE